MDSAKFIEECQAVVAEYTNKHLDITDNINLIPDNAIVKPSEVYVVWSTKVLQNNKALLSTPINDGMYYEITYNGDKDEFYFDAYKKFENRCYKL